VFINEVFYAIGIGTAIILGIAGIYEIIKEWKK